MPLESKKSREAMEHALINAVEFKSGYPIKKKIIKNEYEHIEDIVTINDEYTPYLRHQTDTKTL